MRLLLLDDDFTGEKTLTLRGKTFRYLTKVLRLKMGQKITARDKTGNLWLLALKETKENECFLTTEKIDQAIETTDSLPKNKNPLPNIYLFQAITKQKKFEQITRQATEIGVNTIIPVESKYSTKTKLREERLEAMVTEAIQQSGSLVPTKIEKPIMLEAIADYWQERGPLLVFHQTPLINQPTLLEIIKPKSNFEKIGIIIGSEGGFSNEECDFLRSKKCLQIHLESNILRAETAAIYALSICQFLFTTIK